MMELPSQWRGISVALSQLSDFSWIQLLACHNDIVVTVDIDSKAICKFHKPPLGHEAGTVLCGLVGATATKLNSFSHKVWHQNYLGLTVCSHLGSALWKLSFGLLKGHLVHQISSQAMVTVSEAVRPPLAVEVTSASITRWSPFSPVDVNGPAPSDSGD